MSEIRSKEYFRWIHCVKLVNKVKRSRTKVSKRKDHVSKTSLSILNLQVSGDHYVSIMSLQLRQKEANRCLMIL